jgi:hypothetical protein
MFMVFAGFNRCRKAKAILIWQLKDPMLPKVKQLRAALDAPWLSLAISTSVSLGFAG